MVRAVLGQLAVFHSPEDVRICVCAPPDRIGRWDWVKWLPHNLHPTEQDAAGPVRLMATSPARAGGAAGPGTARTGPGSPRASAARCRTTW